MGFDWVAPKNYKRHYICLDCQKGFKRPSKKDMKHEESADLSDLMERYYALETRQDIIEYIDLAYQNIKAVCPNCGNHMLQVHYNFEVPPHRDDRAWKKLRSTMSDKTKVSYNVPIQWHYLALKKEVEHAVETTELKENLAKLEQANRQ